MAYTSKLIEGAVEEIAKLPGIGKKSALRVVMHLLKQEKSATEQLTFALKELREKIMYCKHCHTISDESECTICRDNSRDERLLCIVEQTQDLIAIEATSQFRGYYHVLGGVIDPLQDVGPDALNFSNLVERVDVMGITEIIMALNPTMQGDTTAHYIVHLLEDRNIKVSAISRGVSVGSELEYVDEVTLGRSILSRTPLY